MYSRSCQALKMIYGQGTSESRDEILMNLETDLNSFINKTICLEYTGFSYNMSTLYVFSLIYTNKLKRFRMTIKYTDSVNNISNHQYHPELLKRQINVAANACCYFHAKFKCSL